MHGTIIRPALLGAMLSISAAMSPVGAEPPQGGGEHRAPPPEAYAACATASAGEGCTITTPDGAVDGTCLAAAGPSLACRPRNPPPGARRAPPPESLAACAALVAGEACSFASPGGTLEGVCVAPQGKPLGCRPNRPPPGAAKGPPPDGSPPDAAR
jgi:hypothetical protein